VLLFTKEEYEAHGQYTVLDQYTYKWRDGRMALALGLGSLFNHSETPNVSYVLDPSNDSIRYMTTKPIDPHQELCIFYGHNLWFEPVSINPLVVTREETDDGWGGLSAVANEVEESRAGYPSFVDGNPCDIISVEDLPFTRLKVTGDDDELRWYSN
jgi:tRNA-specific adenosine deaminase 3